MNQEELLQEIQKLKEENEYLKRRLATFTDRAKRYYEKNKEEILAKNKEKSLKWKQENKDKVKIYNRRAYLKRKEKLLQEKQRETESKKCVQMT